MRILLDFLVIANEQCLYNSHRRKCNYSPVSVGISLHTGTLILGMIGEAKRLEGTVISDAVNLASRLEGLTKLYGASILISKQTLSHLDNPDKYNFRFLDQVWIKGKQKAVSVFEIFDGDPQEIKELKLETKADFEAGLALYHDDKFAEARGIFKTVLERNPDDKVAQLYLERADIASALSEHQVTVLLVDDQPMIGEAVRRMLESEEDIAFHYCSDPTQAIETANELLPTVILQDLVMPDVDGLTLLRFFRANPSTREVPLIVLSTKEEPTIKAEAFALGASDYLVKLPDKIELIARVRYHSKGYINLLQRNRAAHYMAHGVPPGWEGIQGL